MSDTSPWLWSVDELVVHVCHSHALFTAAKQSATNIPNSSVLEAEFRKRNVTGKDFLTAFDTQAIVVRNEFNLPHLGQRLALCSVRELLREGPALYTTNQPSLTSSKESLSNNIARASPASPSGSHHYTADLHRSSRKRRKVEPVLMEPVQQEQTAGDAEAKADDFSHLLRWQDAAEDEIIDFISEDDVAEEDAAEDDVEVSDDSDEEPSTKTTLTTEEIVEIINEYIASCTESWRPNAGVPRGEEEVYDVDAMWDKAEASGQRRNLAQKHEAEYEYYSQRLDRLCAEIVKFPGGNADKVRKQCRNLEGTIEMMELAGWLRDIYKLEPVASDEELESHSVPDDAPGEITWPPSRPVEIIDLGSPPSELEETPSTSFLSNQRHSPTPDSVIVNSALDSFNHWRQLRSPDSVIPESTVDRNSQIRLSMPDSVIAESIEPVARSIEPMASESYKSLDTSGPLSLRNPPSYGDEPENASISSVRRWRWQELIAHSDRKRVVSKIIFEMRPSDRELIRNRVQLGRSALLKEIAACINMLCRRESKLQGVLLRDMPKIIGFTNLFLSWWFCKDYAKELNASVADLEELKRCIEDGSAETATFCNYTHTIMRTTFSEQALQHPEQPSQAEIIEISDDDD